MHISPFSADFRFIAAIRFSANILFTLIYTLRLLLRHATPILAGWLAITLLLSLTPPPSRRFPSADTPCFPFSSASLQPRHFFASERRHFCPVLIVFRRFHGERAEVFASMLFAFAMSYTL